jgi:glycosyltransferase involved in cell wall biosynthesis
MHKILYICSTDLSGESSSMGSVRHIIEVSENLHKLGYRIKLIAPHYSKYPHSTPIDIIYLPIVKIRFLRTIMYEILAPFFILVYIILWSPKLIYWRQSYLTFFPVFLARLLNQKILTEVNGLTIDEIESESLSRLKKKIIKKLERYNYKSSDHLICVAPKIKERIVNHYNIFNEKISVILNGVNSDRMPIINSRKAKKAIGINPEIKVIGFVGHFFPWDGIEYLIEAAPKIIEETKKVKFLIIGHGKWGDHLPELVSRRGLTDYFIFTGKIAWEKLYLYVNAFDVATAPYSNSINMESGRSSLKILEYFACNKPVVASHTVVIPEIVDIDDRCLGKTVKPEDSGELAQAILFFLKNKEKAKNIGNHARAYVLKERSWKVVARRTNNIIKNLITQPKK